MCPLRPPSPPGPVLITVTFRLRDPFDLNKRARVLYTGNNNQYRRNNRCDVPII